MRKLYTLLLSLVILAFSLDAALAQKTKSQLNSEVSTNYSDNTTGLITPSILRTTTNDQIASWVDWLTCSGTGGIVFWSSGTPTCLNIGSAGQFLTVVAGAPSWQNVTSQLTAGTSISITGTSNATIGLSPIGTLQMLSNTTGGSAAPIGTTGSAYLDAVFGSTRGNILVRGATTWGVLGLGTSGQQLVSNGTDLTYSTGTAAKSNVQTFTSSGTWTKPGGFGATANTHIQCWGAGGSGGFNTNAGGAAGGGGGGAYNELWVLLSTLPATVAVTVGAGGTAITTINPGNSGGTTTFGAVLSAFGGGGGSSIANNNASGGGGGGQYSSGANGGTQAASPGSPIIGQSTADGFSFAIGAGDRADNKTPGGIHHGGGGGGGSGGTSTQSSGRSSVWGGGGGGGVSSATNTTGGTSYYGGNGGLGGGTVNGGNGVQPGGGGGGAVAGTTSGAGAAGECIVTTYDGT